METTLMSDFSFLVSFSLFVFCLIFSFYYMYIFCLFSFSIYICIWPFNHRRTIGLSFSRESKFGRLSIHIFQSWRLDRENRQTQQTTRNYQINTRGRCYSKYWYDVFVNIKFFILKSVISLIFDQFMQNN